MCALETGRRIEKSQVYVQEPNRRGASLLERLNPRRLPDRENQIERPPRWRPFRDIAAHAIDASRHGIAGHHRRTTAVQVFHEARAAVSRSLFVFPSEAGSPSEARTSGGTHSRRSSFAGYSKESRALLPRRKKYWHAMDNATRSHSPRPGLGRGDFWLAPWHHVRRECGLADVHRSACRSRAGKAAPGGVPGTARG